MWAAVAVALVFAVLMGVAVSSKDVLRGGKLRR
jgi:hypothetical protein